MQPNTSDYAPRVRAARGTRAPALRRLARLHACFLVSTALAACTIPPPRFSDATPDGDAKVDALDALDIEADAPVDSHHFVLDCDPLSPDAGAVCPCGQALCRSTCVSIMGDLGNCGGCGIVCARDHARASCVDGNCVYQCAPGTTPMGDTCVRNDAPRLMAPLSTTRTTSRTPHLRWERSPNAGSADTTHIQICSDRACGAGSIEQEFDASGTDALVGTALSPGVHFWRAFDVAGGTRSTSPSATWQFDVPRRTSGSTNTFWGTRPDFDGDGHTDLAVGAPQWSAPNRTMTGNVVLFHGVPGGVSTDVWIRYDQDPNPNGGWFGTDIESAGDLDGDGYGELLIGAVYAGPLVHAYLHYGGPDGPNPLSDARLKYRSNDAFGGSISSLGDFDGDGYGDAAIADNFHGGFNVYYGSESGLSTISPMHINTYGGAVVASGDLNGDGISDLVVTSIWNGAQGGTVEVFYGSSTHRNTPSLMFTPPAASHAKMWGCANGDFNGDGYADLALSNTDAGTGASGTVLVYPGSASGIGATPTVTIHSPATTNDYFAVGPAAAGDFNGDGYDDLLVGAARAAPNNAGGVYAYFGGPTGLASTTAGLVPGIEGEGANEGSWLAWAGDVNDDGFDDAFVSAPNAYSQGSVLLMFGNAATGLSASGAVEFQNPEGGFTQFGFSVASSGFSGTRWRPSALFALARPSRSRVREIGARWLR